MSNKPNPDSVAKVLAAGIVPGCVVRDDYGDVGVVAPIDEWTWATTPNEVFSDNLRLYNGYRGRIGAAILEPAPSLPDNFDPQAHSHLLTERFPVTDEQP